MKFLILVCHPNIDKSLNHAIARSAEEHLKSKGHEVRFVDLNKIKFNPTTGPHDFKEVKGKEFFDIQAEQKSAMTEKNFATDVEEQMEHIKWCDVIMYQFPLYWWTYPGILKGWIDRCFGYFAYGGGNSLNKSFLYSITSGGKYEDRCPALFSFDKWKQFGNKIIKPFYNAGIFPWVDGKVEPELFIKRQKEYAAKMKKFLDEHVLGEKITYV